MAETDWMVSLIVAGDGVIPAVLSRRARGRSGHGVERPAGDELNRAYSDLRREWLKDRV